MTSNISGASDSRPESIEMRFKEAELRLREAELQVRKRESDARIAREAIEAKRRVSPATTAIIAAAAAVGGSAITGLASSLSAANQLELETRKFELGVIKDALSADDPEDRLATLRFFLDIGLLSDTDGSLRQNVVGCTAPLPPPAERQP